jgi:flavin-dependent dehydrogenase
VSESELNFCLVSEAANMPRLRQWAEERFSIPPTHPWRTITPLRRNASLPARRRLFLIGDAARIVEPITGEGIYYALASGELAANAIAAIIKGAKEEEIGRSYATAHRKLYRGRLWVNRVARSAVLSPRVSSLVFNMLPAAVLRSLMGRIVR